MRVDAERALVELMCELFFPHGDEVYGLVRTCTEGRASLPPRPESLASLCDSAVQALLHDDNTVTRAVFDELVKLRPAESTRIEASAADWGVAAPTVLPTRRAVPCGATGGPRDLLFGAVDLALPYEVGGATFVLRIRGGSAEVRRMREDGAFGPVVQRDDWSDGWTVVRPYRRGEQVHLFALRGATGDAVVRRIGDDGTIGAVVQHTRWPAGVTSVEFAPSGSLLFLLRAADGAALTRAVAADGTIGAVLDAREQAAGWTYARLYEVGGALRLFLLRAADGAVMIVPVGRDGAVGAPIQRLQWAAGWSTVEFLGDARLLIVRERDGAALVHRVAEDGTIGGMLERHDWSSGWRDAAFFTAGGRPFLLLRGDQGTLVRKLAAPLAVDDDPARVSQDP